MLKFAAVYYDCKVKERIASRLLFRDKILTETLNANDTTCMSKCQENKETKRDCFCYYSKLNLTNKHMSSRNSVSFF